MSKITFDGAEIECLESETVLDALLRNEATVPYSCKKGVCHTCVLRATEGSVPNSAQSGLKDTLLAQNYFLACTCILEDDLKIELPNDADLFGRVVLRSKELLTPNVCRLILEAPNDLYYHAGQFINLRRHDGLVRSYSLASVPKMDTYLELHIKRMKNGEMSNWLFDNAEPGQDMDMQGPNGNCFYLPGDLNQSLLLIGTGTGLAPLIGIARDALNSEHQGDIYLYHGSRHIEGLYLHETLLELDRSHHNLHYVPCLSGDNAPSECVQGRANDVALTNHKNLSGWRVYLCGSPPMVNTTNKLAYLAGTPLSDIYIDPFEVQDRRNKPRQ